MIEPRSRASGVRAVLALIACTALAALLAAGCGSDSSTSKTSETESAPSSGTSADATAPRAKRHSAPAKPAKPKSTEPASPQGEEAGGGGATEARPEAVAKAKQEESESSDQSIQQYGDEAGGSEKSEVVAAMHSFIRAFGAGDYKTVCEEASSALREQTEAYAQAQKTAGPSCPELLSKLLRGSEAGKAKRALEAVVTHVRIKEDSAFVLFKPAGEPVSYFVLVREDGDWKATSFGIGTPLVPPAP
jgi:hypothetical protein